MPQNAKEVKIRLASIKNTRKITKAMELVAAAKMRKAVESAVSTREYYKLAWSIIERLLSTDLYFEQNNPIKRFFDPAENGNRATIITYTSNRGLCGAFNANIIKLVAGYIAEHPNQKVSVIGIGNKGIAILGSRGIPMDLAFRKDENAIHADSMIEVADYAYKKFKDKKTDKVLVAYTDYRSAILQTAGLKQLFPFTRPPQIFVDAHTNNSKNNKPEAPEYLYEPNKFELLEYLIPRMAQVELYQAMLESNASEHSARMLAMKNASDAAKEMADDLLLLYNKARQAAITQEIAEISAGAAALA